MEFMNAGDKIVNLENLNQYLHARFERVDATIEESLRSDTQLTQTVGDYLRSTPSKRLRASMVMLASEACGYEGDASPNVAAGVELVHLATLLHDDVIDQATTRRGRPSINAQWSDSVAILMADFLYSRGFELLLTAIDAEATRMITQVTSRMCEGEMFQIQREKDLLTEDDYLRIVRCKTAYLFAASMAFGSLLAGSNGDIVKRLGDFGMNFGIAFQITDDTLDFTASDSHWGKDLGTDIASGKQTLPLIRALDVANPQDRETLVACLNNGRDFKGVLSQIKHYDGINYALGRAREFATQARESLCVLPQSTAKDYLMWLTDFVIERKF